jgi:hypothetical protein
MRLILALAALAAGTSVASAQSPRRRMGTGMSVWLGLLFALALSGAAHGGHLRHHGVVVKAGRGGDLHRHRGPTQRARPARTFNEFVAAPDGHDNRKCTKARPCSPQGAVNACPDGQVCSIQLQPGLYLDPAVNIYYHRTIMLFGNCEDPNAVIFRATKPGALVAIQDHAIGAVRCLTLEATAPSVVGISGRQHIIADYERVIFGPMPEGTHIGMTEFSVASCIGPIWITGDAVVHAAASAHSKLNLGCHMTLTEPRTFTHFVSAAMFSVVDANRGVFGPAATARAFTPVASATTFPVVDAERAVGSVATNGACSSSNSIVLPPEQGFPGGSPGNC